MPLPPRPEPPGTQPPPQAQRASSLPVSRRRMSPAWAHRPPQAPPKRHRAALPSKGPPLSRTTNTKPPRRRNPPGRFFFVIRIIPLSTMTTSRRIVSRARHTLSRSPQTATRVRQTVPKARQTISRVRQMTSRARQTVPRPRQVTSRSVRLIARTTPTSPHAMLSQSTTDAQAISNTLRRPSSPPRVPSWKRVLGSGFQLSRDVSCGGWGMVV